MKWSAQFSPQNPPLFFFSHCFIMGWSGFCLHIGFKLSVNEGKEQRMKSLTKHTWATYFQQGAGGVYRLHSWHKSTCFFCGLTVFFLCLSWYLCCTESVCVHAAARVCWCEGLKDTWPGTRFSRLQAVTGSKPCGPQTALPSFPVIKNSSSFSLSASCSVLIGTHPRSRLLPLFLSEMPRSSRSAEFPTAVTLVFRAVFPPCYGPLRITWGHQFGVISPIWTMKLLHLRVFVKIRSQEVLLVCQEVSHTVGCEAESWNEV